MVSVMSLWLPILVAAVLVFIVSSVIHMMFTYHNADFDRTPNEDAVRSAIRNLNLPPGDYGVPMVHTKQERASESFQAKMQEGPVLFMTVFPDGPPDMGRSLIQWFAYCLLVGVIAAYVAGTVLAPGTEYLRVFQIVGTVAFAGFGLAQMQNSIWYRRKWSTTFKNLFDGLIYGLVTAGVFGWLWPG